MKILFSLIDEIPPENKEEQQRYFGEIFPTPKPLVVEIGSGNGHFLVEYAQTHPDYNCVGTEILGGRARKFCRKVEKRCLQNIVIFKGDARQFVWEFLHEVSVAEFIVMFPDPWPKKRHHKHRLLRVAFIAMLYYRLVPGGMVSITTDDVPYRDWIIDEFARAGGFRSVHEKGYTLYPDHLPKSLFEKRFREEERELYFMQYEKV